MSAVSLALDSTSTASISAEPFASPAAAVSAILQSLEALGLGRWELVELVVAEPDPPGSVDLRDGAITRWLRPEASGSKVLREVEQATVLTAARVIATLLAIESSATLAFEHAARAERESETDALTGVANARAWWRTLTRTADLCAARDHVAVVAVVDLDELKQVNDQHGHLAGDELLRRAATALKGALRPQDLIARVGGDEFGVLVVVADEEPPEPEHIAQRLRSQLADADLRASVGAACFGAGDRINEVYHRADREMYRVKRGHRSSRPRSAPG